MRNYLSKKFFWDKKHFIQIRIYKDKNSMCADYKKLSPCDETHNVLGVSINRETYKISKKLLLKYKNNGLKDKDWEKLKRVPQTGIVLLHKQQCGAGIATHEIMHATLFAYQRFIKDRNQYPLIIKSMEQEEELLRMFTFMVLQFYNWYWKIEKKLSKMV